jgi:hypothetical protein
MTIRVVKNYKRKPVRVKNSTGKVLEVAPNGTAHLDSSFPDELPAGLAILALQGVPTPGVKIPEQESIVDAPVFLNSEQELAPEPVVEDTNADNSAGQVEINDETLSEEDKIAVIDMVEETIDDDQDSEYIADEPNVTTSEDLLKK